MSDISDRLAKLRRDNGLNQEELAEKLGVSRQAISKWERGESAPDLSNLIALSDLFDVSIDYLAKGKEEEDAAPKEEEELRAPDPESIVYPDVDDVQMPSSSVHSAGQEGRRRSPWATFPYPIAVVLLYLLIGFAFGGWHPWWLLFLTIPVYYWIVQVVIHDPEYIKDHPQYKSSQR